MLYIFVFFNVYSRRSQNLICILIFVFGADRKSNMAARAHNVFWLVEILKIFLLETTKPIELWLCRNDHWVVLQPMRTHYGPWQPCWISNQHEKHKSGRGPSSEHFWQVWLKSVQRFQRRRFKCEKLTDGL
jgi:hypothetical protein